MSFDPKGQVYHVPVLNEVYGVSPEERTIINIYGGKSSFTNHQVDLALFLLHYLLGTKGIALSGKRVSEKELKGGEMFFRGPHTSPTKGLIEKYGKTPKGLIDAGLRVGGKPSELGDAAIELRVAPKIPVTYVLWAEDDEFPASVSILFDPTIQEFIPLDIIYGVTILTHHRLVEG